MTFSTRVGAQSNFSIRVIDKKVSRVMGVQHQKLNVVMNFNGVESNQQINYIGANPSVDKNVSLVALDNHTSFDFNRGTILGQIYNSQYRYPSAKIVAAVNGDFFDINSRIGQNGATAGPHIRDGNVIFEGYNYKNAISVGVKKDGHAFIGKPSFDGYHIEVVDEDGSVKLKDLPVSINALPTDGKLAVLLPSYQTTDPITGNKIIVDTNETIIHRSSMGNEELGRYFLKGYLKEITDRNLDKVEENTMVLIGEDFLLDGLINETDTIKLQNRPSGDFSDVYQVISGNTMLVENGEVLPQTNVDVHPRTATGLKKDGALFFITVDGRQAPKYVGVTYEQLGHILKYFGADVGFNLDGGGSTTVAVFDEAEATYQIHNSPSDGNLRQDANGVGFIYGDISLPLPPIPFPDNRSVLNTITNVLFDGRTVLFDPIENASSYLLEVNGRRFTSETPEFELDLASGTYDVSIKAFGEHETYRQSEKATFELNVYSSLLQQLINQLGEYGSQMHQYQNTNK